MLDDSTPHVFTKSDIMLIQSEMLEDFSKYGGAHMHTHRHTRPRELCLDTNEFLIFSSLSFFVFFYIFLPDTALP